MHNNTFSGWVACRSQSLLEHLPQSVALQCIRLKLSIHLIVNTDLRAFLVLFNVTLQLFVFSAHLSHLSLQGHKHSVLMDLLLLSTHSAVTTLPRLFIVDQVGAGCCFEELVVEQLDIRVAFGKILLQRRKLRPQLLVLIANRVVIDLELVVLVGYLFRFLGWFDCSLVLGHGADDLIKAASFADLVVEVLGCGGRSRHKLLLLLAHRNSCLCSHLAQIVRVIGIEVTVAIDVLLHSRK